jgi:hypothetical protein
MCNFNSRASVVTIATGYGLDDRGVGVRVPVGGSRTFSSSRHPDWMWGSTQPPIQWVRGAFSLWVKQLGSEADQSSAASVEVKNMWICTFTSLYAFMA